MREERAEEFLHVQTVDFVGPMAAVEFSPDAETVVVACGYRYCGGLFEFARKWGGCGLDRLEL